MALLVLSANRSLDRATPPSSGGVSALLDQSAQALNKALSAQDLLAARRAFARLLLALPAGPGSAAGTPLAELGNALAVGDLGAARTAFATVSRLRLSAASDAVPASGAAPSTTGGVAGTRLSEVA